MKILVSIVSRGLESSQLYGEIFGGVTDIHVMAMPADLSGQETWQAIAHSDVLIVDEAIIEKEGYAVLEMLLENYPGVRCLVVMNDFHQDKVVRAILRGVRGVMSAVELRRLLVKAVRQLYAGEVWVPRGCLDLVRQNLQSYSGCAQAGRWLEKPGELHKYH